MRVTQRTDEQVAAYVQDVSRALGALPEDDKAAMLDDLREHATAVLAESPEIELSERLGTPEDFAHELLDAAGINAVPKNHRINIAAYYEKFQHSWLGAMTARAARDFAPLWAALRGATMLWLVVQPMRHQWGFSTRSLLVIGGLIGWLLWSRYRDLTQHNWLGRTVGIAVNLATAAVIFNFVTSPLLAWDWKPTGSASASPVGLAYNGTTVFGIQAFGPDAKPVAVALFDEGGNPLMGDPFSTVNLGCSSDLNVVAIPYLNAAGQAVNNVYPAQGVCVDQDNVVRGEATQFYGEASVQQWTPPVLPQPGQKVVLDANGHYAAVVGSPDATNPTVPTPSPSASSVS